MFLVIELNNREPDFRPLSASIVVPDRYLWVLGGVQAYKFINRESSPILTRKRQYPGRNLFRLAVVSEWVLET